MNILKGFVGGIFGMFALPILFIGCAAIILVLLIAIDMVFGTYICNFMMNSYVLEKGLGLSILLGLIIGCFIGLFEK